MPVTEDTVAARALTAAGAAFAAGRRVKMQELADELGVARMTLNRAVGTRSRLLGEVLWNTSEDEMERLRAAQSGHGARPLAATLGAFIALALDSEPLRVFLHRESTEALAVLTSDKSAFQAKVVTLLAAMLEDEPGLELPLGADDTAYAIVRLLEAFTYTDLLTGGTPDAGKAERAVAALLS